MSSQPKPLRLPVLHDDGLHRCDWPGVDPVYVAYHDTEWGVPEFDSRALFEKLLLDGFQAGLSWITISGEDAPDLMACAPVQGSLVRRAKLSAALIPVALLLATPLAVLIWLSPWVGICAALGAMASSASAGMINLWFEKASPRTTFRNRRSGSVLAAGAETLVGMGWGLTTGVLAAGSAFAVIPGLLTIGGLGILYQLAAANRASLRDSMT